MAVIVYQLVIILSLLGTKVIFPSRLLLAAWIWTGLTIINLFFPPLIVLQLLVIWGTVAMLKPSRAEGGLIATGEKVADHRSAAIASPVKDTVQPSKKSIAPVINPSEAKTKSNASSTPPHLNPLDRVFPPFKLRIDKFLFAPLGGEYAFLKGFLSSERSFLTSVYNISYRKYRMNEWAGANSTRIEMVANSHPDVLFLFPSDWGLTFTETSGDGKYAALYNLHAPYLRAEIERLSGVVHSKFLVEQLNYHSLFLAEIAEALAKNHRLRDQFSSEMKSRGAGDLLRRIDTHLGELTAGRSSPGGSLVSSLADILPRSLFDQISPPGRLEDIRDENGIPFKSGVEEIRIARLPYLERREIEQRARPLQIPYVLHFTRAANLRSILTNGLQPIAKALELGLAPIVNDDLRLDGYRNATSISIAFPNSQMLYKYRSLNQDDSWVILVISPRVLWTKNCAFCQHNAADSRVSRKSLSSLMSLSAFDAMFKDVDDDHTRRDQHLMPFDPTDPQAEALVFEEIKPEEITGLVFENSDALEYYREFAGSRELKVHGPNSGFFSSRMYARQRQEVT